MPAAVRMGPGLTADFTPKRRQRIPERLAPLGEHAAHHSLEQGRVFATGTGEGGTSAG